MTVEKAIEVFNQRYKVGDLIKFNDQGKEKESALRWPAEISEKGRAICWIKEEFEAIDLNNVI